MIMSPQTASAMTGTADPGPAPCVLTINGSSSEAPEAAWPFPEAAGDIEPQTDGACVTTVGDWREVRLSIFARRRRGEPVRDPDDGDDRRMPAPHARVATA